jgi:hypothetical protein
MLSLQIREETALLLYTNWVKGINLIMGEEEKTREPKYETQERSRALKLMRRLE